MLAAFKAESIDYVNLSSSAMQVRKAALADAADMPCWIQMGGLCTGILAAYPVHLQATLPCDESPFTREADVVAEGLALEKRHFTVPTGSGLGSRSIWRWWSAIASPEIVYSRGMGCECSISIYIKGLRRISSLAMLVATVYKGTYFRVR